MEAAQAELAVAAEDATQCQSDFVMAAASNHARQNLISRGRECAASEAALSGGVSLTATVRI